MAARKQLVEQPVDDVLTTAPEGWEWETISEESPTKVIFDTPGDVFIGEFVGLRHITPDNGKDDPFDVFVFVGRDDAQYSINTSYRLIEGMKNVPEGAMCRITYTKDVVTGRGLNPMKDFRVDVRKK